MTRRWPRMALLALVVAGATWLLGWWAVIPLAAAFGWRWRWSAHHALDAALAGTIGWALLLALAIVGDRFASVSASLAGVMRIPAVLLVLATLALPALLAWSASALGSALGRGISD